MKFPLENLHVHIIIHRSNNSGKNRVHGQTIKIKLAHIMKKPLLVYF